MAPHQGQAGAGPAGATEGGCHQREEGSGGHTDCRGEAGRGRALPRGSAFRPSPCSCTGPWEGEGLKEKDLPGAPNADSDSPPAPPRPTSPLQSVCPPLPSSR